MIWGRKQAAHTDRIAPGTRIYAVGDIHGRVDLLDQVAHRIVADITESPAAGEVFAIFMGDYIDRGPSSAAVINYLVALKREWNAVFLRGNHEALLLDFLENPLVLQNWGGWGGFPTLLSYGLTSSLQPDEEECLRLSEAFRAALPRPHLEFLNHLQLSFTRDDYFFVHAGIRPHVPLHSQTEADLLWIRDEFLLYGRRFEKLIVHGHTPVSQPDVRPNRINIDTGAYATGNLTCLVLEGETRRFI